MKKRTGTKRNIFSELMEGVDAMGAHRIGKLTLRTHDFPDAEVKESPGGEFFVAAREKFNVSRAVWANMLRISPRTVEKWEQGGQVSPLAATFVELVARYPDTIDRLQTLPKRVSRSTKAPLAHSRFVSVSRLFGAAGLSVCGPVRWTERVPEKRPGVYVVATSSDPSSDSGLDRIAGLPKAVAIRWVPSQSVLYAGCTSRSLSIRLNQFYRHKHGDRSPHRGGQDVKLLSCALWVFWAPTETPEEAEVRMIEEFEEATGRLPFGNLKRPSRVAMDSQGAVASA
jgi:putative transcriptional regulator